MTGFVKLRRGLAAHVRSHRMTLVEHGAYTLLLQLADHSTGSWRGTQRSFAAAAGVSSGLAWKILTSLERKGYVQWDRDRRIVQICKFFVEKRVEDSVENPVEIQSVSRNLGYRRDQAGHLRDRLIRNTRTLLEKRDLARSPEKISGSPSQPESESQIQNPNRSDSGAGPEDAVPPAEPAVGATPASAVLAEFLREFGRLAVAQSLSAGASRSDAWRRRELSRKARRSAADGWDRSPP